MKWRKLGKIFDPSEHKLPHGCEQFAQSPQALVLDDRIRIYFSSRQVDSFNGKFLSRILFVDMKKDLSGILEISNKEVISLGALGTFDEHGIFPINVLRKGELVYAYTCGWSRRQSVSVETSIGLAISYDNGKSFSRNGQGPVLTSSLFEPVLVGDAFVKEFNGLYHMWYIFGKEWKEASFLEGPARVYKIAHATSKDGVTWTKEEGVQIVKDKLGNDECQALPTVIRIGDQYHMFFCFREATDFRMNPQRAYRIGHAVSSDLLIWHRNDDNPKLEVSEEGEWDSEMLCYPNVFENDGVIVMLYNGNHFGKFGFGAAILE